MSARFIPPSRNYDKTKGKLPRTGPGNRQRAARKEEGTAATASDRSHEPQKRVITQSVKMLSTFHTSAKYAESGEKGETAKMLAAVTSWK